MFLSETHLPQLLDPSCYISSEFFEREMDSLFRASWQCLGITDDFPRDGSFTTREIFGQPILIWFKDGEPHAFLNVCAHRFAKLRSESCGVAEKLACQYHGWQYGTCGNTQRIPDAQSFKPLADKQLGLVKLPSQTVGKLLFVRLTANPEAMSLADQLGDSEEVIEKLFRPRFHQVFQSEEMVDANWKVVIENAIESYHVDCVHAKSFSLMPDAKDCNHQLHNEFTRFETTSPSMAPAPLRAAERMIHRILGHPFVERYRQYHVYPNLMVSTSKFVSVLMHVQPHSPTQTKFGLRVFADPGERRNPIARIAFWMASRWAIKEVRKVLAEDFGVLPAIQQGIQSKTLPSKGLISVREERIFHFQQYLQNMLH